jgi:hypothetical protein
VPRNPPFAGIFEWNPRRTFCLPCRRSWVRIPSAASERLAICRSFSFRQPASASASPCTQCAPAGLDVPVGAEKDRICRSFAHDRTTDLLRGQKGQGFESRGPRVARSGDPQCSCRRQARSYVKWSSLIASSGWFRRGVSLLGVGDGREFGGRIGRGALVEDRRRS